MKPCTGMRGAGVGGEGSASGAEVTPREDLSLEEWRSLVACFFRP